MQLKRITNKYMKYKNLIKKIIITRKTFQINKNIKIVKKKFFLI